MFRNLSIFEVESHIRSSTLTHDVRNRDEIDHQWVMDYDAFKVPLVAPGADSRRIAALAHSGVCRCDTFAS